MNQFVLLIVFFSLVLGETVYEYRNNRLKENRGHMFQYYDDSTKLNIVLYPYQRVIVSNNETLDEDQEYLYFEDPSLSFIQYGTDIPYNASRIYAKYYHSELYHLTSPDHLSEPILRVNYLCCSMHSMEHHIQYSNSSYDEKTYIYSFQSIPTIRVNQVTIDLYACSILLCDQFSDEQIKSYHSIESYRHSIPSKPMDQTERQSIVEEIQSLFLHGFQGYMYYAYPHPQLDPLTCDKARFPQSDIPYMTLIDTLDTLHVMGFDTLFIEGVRQLEKLKDFDFDENVSVFETTIRFLGGLESAHMFLIDNATILEEYNRNHPSNPYHYSNHLLHLAEDLGNRLLPAFQSSGLAYGSVNLRRGVLPSETPISSLAGIGSSLLEFAALSALTNKLTYLDTVRRCMVRLFELRSPYDLMGKHLDIQSQRWTESISCFGRNSDSYYEYLLKGYILLNDPQLYDMFMTLYYSLDSYNKANTVHWYGVTECDNPDIRTDNSYSLSAFWPGVQFLLGDYIGGKTSINRFLYAWDYFGYIPEYFSIMDQKVIKGGENYPLRPELIESMMYHDIVFNNNEMIEWGKMILHSLNNTKTKCGFSSIHNIFTGDLENEMPSYMLSETLKYLYLLYDNSSVYRGREWLFTTEGHLFNISHIQTNKWIRSYIDDLNSLYEEENEETWDLHCNAGYLSEFQNYCISHSIEFSHDDSRPRLPLQCPAIQVEEILQRWYIYEDLVYYSSHNDSWKDYFVITGYDHFPSVETVSSSSDGIQEAKENTVTLVFGNDKKSIHLERGELSEFMKLFTSLNHGGSIDSSTNVRLLEKLGLFQQMMAPPVEVTTDSRGYDVKSFSMPNGEKLVSRMKPHVKVVLFYQGTTLGLVPISSSMLISYLEEDDEVVSVSIAEKGLEDTKRAKQVECLLRIDGYEPLNCLIHTRLDDVMPLIETRLSEGIVTFANASLLILQQDSDVYEFLVMDPIDYEGTSNAVILGDISLEASEMVNLHYTLSLHIKESEYPRISWYDKNVLIETGVFSVGVVGTEIKKGNIFINGTPDVTSILASFRTIHNNNENNENSDNV